MRLRLAAGALSLLSAPAWAAPVSVTIASPGISAEGTVVVFDPKDTKPPATRDTASIDQVERQFVPRISVLRTGTAVRFPNSDNVRHQVYSFSAPRTFTLKLYSGQPSEPVVFDKPGLVVLGCNIHDKMSAFVAVVDTPYFGKADAAGVVAVNLPAGHYRLRVWNPNLSAPVEPQEVTVQDTAVTLRVPVSIQPTSPTVAAWPE